MSDIFISYTGEDRSTAAAMASALETYGWSVWWDRELVVGDDYADVIERAHAASRCVVVLWSRGAAKSPWVRAEGQRAFDAQKVVPVMLDDLALPLPLSYIQASRLAGWDRSPGDPLLDELRANIATHFDTSQSVADAGCPLFRCAAIGDWGCIAGGQDGVVRIWVLRDGLLVRELTGHGDLATAVSSDGDDVLASGSADRTARLWSLNDGRCLHTLVGHGGPVDDVALGGETVVTASSDRTVRWWSIESGQPLHSHAFDHPVVSCASNGSGDVVAAGDAAGQVALFRGRAPDRVIDAHDGAVYSVELAPAGDRLLTTGADSIARLWDLSTGSILQTFRGHRRAVLSGAFTSDVVVTGSADGTVRVWDPTTGHQRDQIAGLVGGAPGVDITDAGRIVMTGADGQVRTTEPLPPPVPLEAHSGGAQNG